MSEIAIEYFLAQIKRTFATGLCKWIFVTGLEIGYTYFHEDTDYRTFYRVFSYQTAKETASTCLLSLKTL